MDCSLIPLGPRPNFTQLPIFVLEGGNRAWGNDGFPLETTSFRYTTKPIDRYVRTKTSPHRDPPCKPIWIGSIDWWSNLNREHSRLSADRTRRLTAIRRHSPARGCVPQNGTAE